MIVRDTGVGPWPLEALSLVRDGGTTRVRPRERKREKGREALGLGLGLSRVGNIEVGLPIPH